MDEAAGMRIFCLEQEKFDTAFVARFSSAQATEQRWKSCFFNLGGTPPFALLSQLAA